MAYKNTFELISKDIQDIEKLVANFQNYSRIPDIEIDLALSKLRNVYDILLMFRESSPEPEKPEIVPAKETKPVVQEEKKEPEKKPVKDNPKPPDVQGNEQILAEKFKRESDLSTRLNASPIKSIAGTIGINDKFFFIRELFSGDAETFRQTMNTLDEAENFNNAYNYLVKTYGWDMDTEAVQKLLNLIRRKFISSGNE